MILLRESEEPKSLGEKISEYVASPPKPVLRFYGDFSKENSDGGQYLHFAVRNGVPLPLLYGIYTTAKYYDSSEYIEKTDHIGPFSTDKWCLTIDNREPVVVEIRVGIVPFEILTDRAEVVL